LRGRSAQSISDALDFVVGGDRRELFRAVVMGWLPRADVEDVQLSSSEGSWEVALRATVRIAGYGRPLGKDGKTWVLPGLEPFHGGFPQSYATTLGAALASRAARQSALTIRTTQQWHVRRKLELPKGSTVIGPPQPTSVAGRPARGHTQRALRRGHRRRLPREPRHGHGLGHRLRGLRRAGAHGRRRLPRRHARDGALGQGRGRARRQGRQAHAQDRARARPQGGARASEEAVRLTRDVPLAPLTTLGVGGRAAALAHAEHEDDVVAALALARDEGWPVLVLGGGSNVLVADEGFRGLVLRPAVRGVVEKVGAPTIWTVGAGEPWDALVARAVQRGLSGLECLSGIPGDVGGTPIQNVGAYGAEVSDTLVSVTLIERETG
jgi:hypothetical protein